MNNNINNNYTIKDIADLAEVSRATVDRVIHGRGKVSKDAYTKITQILKKIDYQPNLVARTLRKGELYRLAVLVPDYEYDVYWKKAINGINNAMLEYSFIGVTIDMFLFNPFKEASFVLNSKKILKGNYSGVLVSPVFYNESIEFFKEADKAGLKYVTFNTQITESNTLSHVGQDLKQSGKTAASLFYKCNKNAKELLILHIDEDILNAKHMQEKEKGFRDYFINKGSFEIKTLRTGYNNIEKLLINHLEEYPDTSGIFVSTSKVHFIADIIEAYSLDMLLIGYDLIEENIEHLKSGNIDFLIFQNPRLQASLALTMLVDHLAFNKEVPRLNHFPIEIVVKENCSSF